MADELKLLTVLIADDHKLVAEAISEVLKRTEQFTVSVVDTFSVAMERATQTAFDLILLDFNLEGVDGAEGVGRMVTSCPKSQVVIISGNIDRDSVLSSIAAGAMGYIPKTAPIRSLGATLRLIHSGETYLPISVMASASSVTAKLTDALLTENDIEMLRGIEIGKSNKEIGRQMSITEVRVKMNNRALFKKLGAKNRTHAVMIAKAMGVI